MLSFGLQLVSSCVSGNDQGDVLGRRCNDELTMKDADSSDPEALRGTLIDLEKKVETLTRE